MASLKVLILVLVLLAVSHAAVISCPWTHFRLKVLNDESIRLLENMGGLMPWKCLEKGGRAFPDEMFMKAQNEDLAVVALHALKGVARIFNNKQTSVAWDLEKLDLFKNIISRQVENLQNCLGEDTSQSEVVSSSADSRSAVLKSYFEELEEKLRRKGFGECAWEMVKDEVHHGLVKFQTFLERRK